MMQVYERGEWPVLFFSGTLERPIGRSRFLECYEIFNAFFPNIVRYTVGRFNTSFIMNRRMAGMSDSCNPVT